ncbi:helix-turn-helix domain-containing protein [Frankia sp. AgKG'84/4]|uniref:helix-turn-helix domain-containing protein n=1 Tax=Frankia sp. AgKG'84/4 TaxID=573490 RepID=UPI00202A30F4|nr:helix-turn-helix domain-containing protein [Frankia sp. AgKG'84/4]MCL9796908.1 helix-turn-helix domain-containing protein [Frankia sp. AgKG'84/4]
MLPDGCVDIIWHSDGRLIVAGPDTAASTVRWAPGVRYAGLRFDPGLGPAHLGVGAEQLRDSRVELADLWGAGPARRLAERVAAAADPATALAAELAGRATHPGLADPLAPAIVAGIRGGVAVPGLARAVGLSERQLLRRCRRMFGYGPKTLARILRLQEAVRVAGPGRSLADVAADAGYADQAHLAREVRTLAGVTPTGLLAAGPTSAASP